MPAMSLQGTRIFVLAWGSGGGKFLGQRSSPLVMAVVWTRMRCSLAVKLGVGTRWLEIMITFVFILSGWRMASWKRGSAMFLY